MAGVDALIERGIADPDRLGVIGGSYGGFMAAWLVTQTDRFAASVAVSPVTDWYSQHLTSNLGLWNRQILKDELDRPGGEFFNRSPIVHAANVKTPTLCMGGLRDRCTPPGQAIEFFQALAERGVETALALYPEEGHGVHGYPAAVDFCTRFVGWFERHMPPNRRETPQPQAETGTETGTGTGTEAKPQAATEAETEG
jgi:dipeptidyl aminopeptidase/acylaminoacyl peptidase